jgi:hypothetical protein
MQQLDFGWQSVPNSSERGGPPRRETRCPLSARPYLWMTPDFCVCGLRLRPAAHCDSDLPLTDIHPLPVRHFGQLRRADPDGTVDGSRRRRYFIEVKQGLIEIDPDRLG